MLDEKKKVEMIAKGEKYRKEFLKKWDGKCSICERPVSKSHLFKNGMPDMINGAVGGDYIEVYGHPTCVQNVDKLVVLPNRMRII
jgi:hypothetical protein